MQRKHKAKKRGSRSRIVDDLTADAIREVAEAWSRAESDWALTDGSDLDPERGPEDERMIAGERVRTFIDKVFGGRVVAVLRKEGGRVLQYSLGRVSNHETPGSVIGPELEKSVDNPLGETLRIGDPANSEAYEIVGLVPDTKYGSLREPPRPIVFLPVDPAGDPRPFTDFMVRSALPPGQIQTAVRQTLASRSPVLGVDVHVYDDTIRRQIGPERLLGVLSAFFGGLSLLIAAIGLYGVMSYLVARRTNEMGVRVALGAGRSHVVGLVLREAAVLSGSGLALGSALALAGADTVRSLVFGVGPRDVLPLTLACMLLGTVAVLASLVPAWRAARVEPLTALHMQ